MPPFRTTSFLAELGSISQWGKIFHGLKPTCFSVARRVNGGAGRFQNCAGRSAPRFKVLQEDQFTLEMKVPDFSIALSCIYAYVKTTGIAA